MANSIQFKVLNDAELVKSLGRVKTFSEKLPKKSFSNQEINAKLKKWQGSLATVAEPPVQLNRVLGVAIKANDVAGIRAIHESTTPTAEAIVGQKMSPDKVIGTLFSSVSTLEFVKMESEYKKRLGAATTPAAKAKVNKEWADVVQAGTDVFASGGLKGVTEAKLREFSTELTKSKANFNAIVNIANTGVAVASETTQAITRRTILKAGFVVQTGTILDSSAVAIAVPGLCDRPFAEGSFTRHFHKGFNLTVRIPYWCPTWRKPWRICHKNLTLAGLSLDLDVRVGYRVTCCGATAFGQASAQACGTLLGQTLCAGCVAQITGVAGFGRTGAGNSCTYGFGIVAQLKCTFGGVTVLNVQAPFGFSVNGPCPPAGLCP